MKVDISDQTLERWLQDLKTITKNNPKFWSQESENILLLSLPTHGLIMHLINTVDNRGDGRIILSFFKTGNTQDHPFQVMLDRGILRDVPKYYATYLALYHEIEEYIQNISETTERQNGEEFIKQINQAFASAI
ncbi:MAG: hypothetical protein AAB968_00505 [Patescibacteria group bacterium]